MELIRFLFSRSPRILIFAVLIGFLSGSLNSLLLAVVNTAISQKGRVTLALALAFLGLTILAPFARVISELLLVMLGQNAILALRTELSEQVLNVPLRQLEEVGAHRILSVLTDDIPNITNMMAAIPVLCINCGLVVSCFAYMGWLQWRLLLVVLAAMAIGIFTYIFGRNYAVRNLRSARKHENQLQKHFQGLIRGIKELKLHERRRQEFLETELHQTARNVCSENISGLKIYAIVSSWGQLLVFLTIGIVISMLVAGAIPNSAAVTGFTLALLYVMTPLQVLMNSSSGFARANIAIQNVQTIGLKLTRASLPKENSAQAVLRHSPARIDIVGVTYAYRQEGSEFNLGPINLAIDAGELLFIAGGNGSGKTTLAKLITGLYTPDTGKILYDGQPVTQERQDQYRQSFSAVFADSYLFERLHGLQEPGVEERAQDYLARLRLDNKVRVQDGALSTIDLSQGQRKRLALLIACLEDRPIYFFDEWAADQDPVFKRFFYLDILPGLKACGKTVIVISHDDRYYNVSDRLVVLESGQLTATVPGFSVKTAIS